MLEITSILIVDDETLFARKFELALKRIGMSTQGLVHCKTSIDSLEQFRKIRFDCSFLDIFLETASPKDGFGVLDDFLDVAIEGQLIGMISTSMIDAEIRRAETEGAGFYIVKGLSQRKFVERMRIFKQMYIDGDHQGFELFNGDE